VGVPAARLDVARRRDQVDRRRAEIRCLRRARARPEVVPVVGAAHADQVGRRVAARVARPRVDVGARVEARALGCQSERSTAGLLDDPPSTEGSLEAPPADRDPEVQDPEEQDPEIQDPEIDALTRASLSSRSRTRTTRPIPRTTGRSPAPIATATRRRTSRRTLTACSCARRRHRRPPSPLNAEARANWRGLRISLVARGQSIWWPVDWITPRWSLHGCEAIGSFAPW
jgi:hypothetical protein